MIAGIDHVSFSAESLEQAEKLLLPLGYKRVFTEIEIPNPPEKKPLLETYTSSHDLGFYRAPQRVAIEATVHGRPSNNAVSNFKVDIKMTGQITALVPHVSEEAEFWTSAFGCKGRSQNSDTALLEFRSFKPELAGTLTLEKGSFAGASYLDSKGFPCLALLSTNIEKDLERAEACGAVESTGVFRIGVHDRMLKIAMFRSPAGFLCELIQGEKNG